MDIQKFYLGVDMARLKAILLITREDRYSVITRMVDKECESFKKMIINNLMVATESIQNVISTRENYERQFGSDWH